MYYSSRAFGEKWEEASKRIASGLFTSFLADYLAQEL
jgi:hypothetical protein